MANLKKFLNQLLKEFHQIDFLSSDPLEFVHRYPKDPWDQEAVALIAAVLAYGNVKQIRKSIQTALTKIHSISEGPKDFVVSLKRPAFQKKAYLEFQDFVHRFNSGYDLVSLLTLLSKSWSEYGSLGTHFVTHLHSDSTDIGYALDSLITEWKDWSRHRESSSFSYLMTSPRDGSCCKRWCMLLRWMGRKDHLDPGLWTKNSPLLKEARSLEARQLVMPLDTHTGRISQYLGLTKRKSLNWKAALEVTEALKTVDPDDPTRYDFALSRLGILDLCQKKYRAEICKKCQLLPVCQFAKKHLQASVRSGVSVYETTSCY